ncbi:MAG: DUF5622 domain-containing protein [Ignisphaera sp.]|jgi:hypothetical protein|nr:DUF5622 domain-containing protein [Ignisphaera sp.]MCC6055846.1 DUF5622 domain-containing protein [Desulfurococcaceae archaeon]
MGLKHKKYVYVKRIDGIFVKIRVLKSRQESESKYIIVGPKFVRPPQTATVISEESLPETVRKKLYSI